MSYFYYDFMFDKEKIFLRESLFLHRFFDSVHGKPVISFIAENYIGDIYSSPNSGLFADAYVEFGVFGMLLMPFFIVLLLRLIDCVSVKVNEIIMLPCLISLILFLLSVSIVGGTFIYTFILLLLFLYLVPRSNLK
jgi:hypothetical protein